MQLSIIIFILITFDYMYAIHCYYIIVITYYLFKYLLRPISNASIGITCNNDRIKIGAATINIIKCTFKIILYFSYKFRNIIYKKHNL